MSPRRYNLGARASAMVETRQRIVEAATALHGERGVIGTSWEDIAEVAGVAPATVYRHFPSLTEMIPACARAVLDVARPPTIEEARQKFAEIDTPIDRFEFLVRESCHCYARGAAWLHAARRERDLIPAIDEVVRLQEEALTVLVSACLGDQVVSRRTSQALFVLCDFPFWKQLADRGASRKDIPDTVIDLIRSVLGREGIR